MKKKIFALTTLGCKVNQYETEVIREDLLDAGCVEADFKKRADIYVINTCTVTQKTDKESRRLIRDAYRLNPKAKIVVTGCYVQKDADDIKNIDGVSLLVRNEDKFRIAELLNTQMRPAAQRDKRYAGDHGIRDFTGHEKAFVKIQDGCDNYCSFCKIPLVRGGPKSRSLNSILDEIDRLGDGGFKEIVLCGICLGKWGQDMGIKGGLADVLEGILKIDKDFRIRLSSIEPYYVTDRLLKIILKSERVCCHLHIPLQSGDDHILRLMNRRYTSSGFLKLINRIRCRIPDIAISTDVMVGFPGEEDRNFRNTVKLARKARFSRIHIFSYSPRQGTKAAGFPYAPDRSRIGQRVRCLENINQKMSLAYAKAFLHKRLDVLVENKRDRLTGHLTGYTGNYINVILRNDKRGNIIGRILPVRIEKVTNSNIIARIITFKN